MRRRRTNVLADVFDSGQAAEVPRRLAVYGSDAPEARKGPAEETGINTAGVNEEGG